MAGKRKGRVVQSVRNLESSGEITPLYLFRYRTPDTGVEVRDGFASDAPTLAAIGSRAFVHTHSGTIHPVDLAGVASRFDAAEIRTDIETRRSRWLVAQWSRDTVGGAELRISKGPDSAGEHPMELGGIYVAPDWSGYGVGSALVEACSRLARKLGHDALWVRYFESNHHATEFLEHAGFVVVNRETSVAGLRSQATVLTLARPV